MRFNVTIADITPHSPRSHKSFLEWNAASILDICATHSFGLSLPRSTSGTNIPRCMKFSVWTDESHPIS